MKKNIIVCDKCGKEFEEKNSVHATVFITSNGTATTRADLCADCISPVVNSEEKELVEVKHGKWIDKPTDRYMHIGSWCSVCQEKSGIGGIESNRHKPYCPNCGAKMDLEEGAET